MQQEYAIWLFKHDAEDLQPYKRISSHPNLEDAIESSFRIMKLLCQDYKEELYLFMENSKMTFSNMDMLGIHIFNGNIPFGLFVQNGELAEKPKIGPLTEKKDELIRPSHVDLDDN